ncbi:LD-carboxypeptidase [Deinococcus metallilatus]|uniref:LD-carboxypeptidase n=1 Tax=Deinococcus metallilatus TaxID=1211322 RepID=A0AAJ5JZ24_9DEIO|nr:S66 peptidase family protein [Deinococcus metallilatus]MBB5294392.1 muramoyltetrapeptide carboxypeptidase LdcA involved in peptidoglycan recycling [Deinococcus metallilatus]QBY10147.1 LD-carboxypeptidase [Deinococcus metallilatus]RXJ13873.1 LD-carboxypeptidase [Deinococcus metallilatus]TLK29839.1 LD-carboxypeptidase [Deinococcus metallilatus]GMA15608.1 LD-carboxypeptidase [Deinococcus metallilatus]
MTPRFLRPPRLAPGSRVAALSLSSGFVTEVMGRYRAGVRQVASAFGWEVVPAPNALRGPDFLSANPQARADDLHWALQNPEIGGLVSIIGGDDSVRLLPYLNLDLIRQHPKPFLGYSDSTVTLMQFLRAGVMAYHGPALLTDLAENGGIHPFVVEGVRRVLVEDRPFDLHPAPEWTEFRQDWADEPGQEVRRPFQPGEGWTWLQGEQAAEGHLLGGCLEVLDMLNGTPGWPAPGLWEGAVLALETSEEVPPPQQVGYWLRNYAAQGILARAAGLLLARPRGYTPEMVEDLYRWVRRVLAEAGRPDLPVVANVDFGHTSPQLTLPLGGLARLDPVAERVTVTP